MRLTVDRSAGRLTIGVDGEPIRLLVAERFAAMLDSSDVNREAAAVYVERLESHSVE